jgi:hypothetical protein
VEEKLAEASLASAAAAAKAEAELAKVRADAAAQLERRPACWRRSRRS